MSLSFLSQFEEGSTLHTIELLKRMIDDEDATSKAEDLLPPLTRDVIRHVDRNHNNDTRSRRDEETVVSKPAINVAPTTLGFLARQEEGMTPSIMFLHQLIAEEDTMHTPTAGHKTANTINTNNKGNVRDNDEANATVSPQQEAQPPATTSTLSLLAAIDEPCTSLNFLAKYLSDEDSALPEDKQSSRQTQVPIIVSVPDPPAHISVESAALPNNSSFTENAITPSRLPKPKPFTMLGTAVGAGSPSLIIAGRMPPPPALGSSPRGPVLQHFDCNDTTPGKGGDILPPTAIMTAGNRPSMPAQRRLSPRELAAHHHGTSDASHTSKVITPQVLMDDPNRSDYVSRWFEKLYYRKALVVQQQTEEGSNDRESHLSILDDAALKNVKVVPVAEFLPPRSVMEHHYKAPAVPQAPSTGHPSGVMGIRAELFQHRLAEVLDRSAISSATPSAVPSAAPSVMSSAVKPTVARGRPLSAAMARRGGETAAGGNYLPPPTDLILGPAPTPDTVTSPVRRINLLSAARRGRASAPPQPLQPKALAFGDDGMDDTLIREDKSGDLLSAVPSSSTLPARQQESSAAFPRHIQAIRSQQYYQPTAPPPLSPSDIMAKGPSQAFQPPLHRYARPQSPAATANLLQQRRSLLRAPAEVLPKTVADVPPRSQSSLATKPMGTTTTQAPVNSRVSLAIQTAQRIARERSQSAGKRR